MDFSLIQDNFILHCLTWLEKPFNWNWMEKINKTFSVSIELKMWSVEKLFKANTVWIIIILDMRFSGIYGSKETEMKTQAGAGKTLQVIMIVYECRWHVIKISQIKSN